MIREIKERGTAHHQTEGGGFKVRRPLPSHHMRMVDPFLLLDEMGPSDYAPGEGKGAPDHPHRGFETVTYMLDGEFEHRDSVGNHGVLKAGDVQWMTAGAGIIHSEMPSDKIMREGGRVHGFQLWVNLPREHKMMQPRYQEIAGANIPHATTDDGLADARVIAGKVLGVEAVIDTVIPIHYHDWTLRPGADVTFDLVGEVNAFVYVFQGSLQVGDDQSVLNEGDIAALGDGDQVRLTVPTDADIRTRALLLAGKPLNEPVARHGPFVMNTAEEIEQAVRDYQNGVLGSIPST